MIPFFKEKQCDKTVLYQFSDLQKRGPIISRRMIKIILFALGVLIGFGSCQNCDFNYVKKYTIDGIVNDATVRDNFMMDIMTWEGKFATDKIGLNYKHGLTYDGNH